MKLYIPEIGDIITLSSNWNFSLYEESRNEDLMKVIGQEFKWNRRDEKRNWQVMLPKGTELKIDRIYIRKGVSDYSSLTFFINSSPDTRITKKIRFWAKLSDVNTIEFDNDNINKVLINRIVFEPKEYVWGYSEYILNGRLDLDWTGKFLVPSQQKLIEMIGLVNGKQEIELKFNLEITPITKDQLSVLKFQNNNFRNSTAPDRRISKYSVTAIHIPTGKEIGTAKTDVTLKKKIKEFYKSL